jgi:hypothetical protein
MKTLFSTLLLAVAAWAQGPQYPYSVSLTWTPSTTQGVTAQNVWRAPYATTCGTYAVLTAGTNLSPTVTTFTDSTVAPGASYCYAVTSYNANGNSALDQAGDNPSLIPPAPPTGLNSTVAQSGGQEKATFTFMQSPTQGITKNQLLCGKSSNGKFTMQAQSTRPVTTFSGDAPAGTAYCEVTAMIGNVASAPSNQTKIVVP